MTNTQELVKRLEAGENTFDLEQAIGNHFHPNQADIWPNYINSLDAALALVERVRPGWTIACIGQDDYKQWHCELCEGHQTSYDRVVITMTFATPAAALIAALLKAEG